MWHNCLTNRGETNVRLSILLITLITVALQWMFLIQVTNEITRILNISVFFTKQTVERRKNKKEVSDINSNQKDVLIVENK